MAAACRAYGEGVQQEAGHAHARNLGRMIIANLQMAHAAYLNGQPL
jgi:hypothetical protein